MVPDERVLKILRSGDFHQLLAVLACSRARPCFLVLVVQAVWVAVWQMVPQGVSAINFSRTCACTFGQYMFAAAS